MKTLCVELCSLFSLHFTRSAHFIQILQMKGQYLIQDSTLEDSNRFDNRLINIEINLFIKLLKIDAFLDICRDRTQN